MKIHNLNHQFGLTVVELMVGLMLSLLLVGGVIQIYLGTKTTYSVTEGLSRLQENTRFSLDLLARDIRMAGYIPCSRPETTTNVVSSPDWWASFFETPIKGFEDNTSPVPGVNAAIGTDSILILRGGDRVAGVNFLDATNNQIVLQRNLETEGEWVEDGSLMVACDATHATLFQADDIQSNVVTTVEIADSGNVPGNTGTNLGHAFGNDAQISNYSAVIYYVSDADSGDGFSLHRRYLNVNPSKQVALSNSEELAEGIESMQILYGIDTDATADGVADRYVNADAINDDDWGSVVTVRIGILYASEDGLRNENGTDDNTYIVANTTIGVTGDQDETHAQDNRKRYVSNMTINIRNI